MTTNTIDKLLKKFFEKSLRIRRSSWPACDCLVSDGAEGGTIWYYSSGVDELIPGYKLGFHELAAGDWQHELSDGGWGYEPDTETPSERLQRVGNRVVAVFGCVSVLDDPEKYIAYHQLKEALSENKPPKRDSSIPLPAARKKLARLNIDSEGVQECPDGEFVSYSEYEQEIAQWRKIYMQANDARDAAETRMVIIVNDCAEVAKAEAIGFRDHNQPHCALGAFQAEKAIRDMKVRA